MGRSGVAMWGPGFVVASLKKKTYLEQNYMQCRPDKKKRSPISSPVVGCTALEYRYRNNNPVNSSQNKAANAFIFI
jgi:hypothetical protein